MFILEEEKKNPMIISLIAALSPEGIIGNKNRIPWKSKEDLQFFRETTMGKPIIMGRTTWDSLNGKPLKGRFNIVLTKNKDKIGTLGDTDEGPLFMGGLTEAFTMLSNQDAEEVFIIGGAQVYDEALRMDYVDQMYINRMKIVDVKGDAWFPFIEESLWIKEESETKFNDFNAYLYTRKREPEDINPL